MLATCDDRLELFAKVAASWLHVIKTLRIYFEIDTSHRQFCNKIGKERSREPESRDQIGTHFSEKVVMSFISARMRTRR